MIDVQKLSIDDLSKGEILNEISVLVTEYTEADNVDEARDLLVVLRELLGANQNFSQNYPALFKDYQKIIVLLKFVVLHTLPEREVVDLFKKHLLTVIKNNVNLVDKLDSFFLLYKDEFFDHQSRKNFVKVLAENTEIIGSKALRLEIGTRFESPTISNWLKDFARSFPSDRRLTYLEEVEYTGRSPNFRKLSVEERDILLKIFRLFNYLRFPVEKGFKVKETGHRVGAVPATLPVKEPLSVPPKNPLEVLKQKYQDYRQQRERVLELEDGILVRTQGEVEQIKKELAVASRNDEKNKVIACVKIMARQKALITALRDNPAWLEAVSGYIVSKYGQQYNPEDVTAALSNIKMDLTAPAALSEFLQYLLKDKLKMGENDSALVGVEIGQLLGDQYQGLAYGSQETGSFEWTKNKIEDQRLVSEVE
jgi:hypothetical protein